MYIDSDLLEERLSFRIFKGKNAFQSRTCTCGRKACASWRYWGQGKEAGHVHTGTSFHIEQSSATCKQLRCTIAERLFVHAHARMDNCTQTPCLAAAATLLVDLEVLVNYLSPEGPDLASIILHEMALPRNYRAEARAAVDQTYMLQHRTVQAPKDSHKLN